MATPTTLDQTLERFFEEPLLFEPGRDFAYSGVGYLLLAKVIEEVSGIPYAGFLSREIFVPLQMTSSGADVPEVIIPGRAAGYVQAEGEPIQNAPNIYMPVLTGAGDLYSTVSDLSRWNQALSSGTLLSEEGYEAMYRPELNNYAYGWLVSETPAGHDILFHSGGVPGFASLNFRVPSAEVAVVVLTNLTPARLPRLASQILSLVLSGGGAGSGSF
jgi:CubicO group peptidase (beta-lactamase class C family)